ncbi:MAG: hypothetical protein AB1609_17340 [Bacillota bacterium]
MRWLGLTLLIVTPVLAIAPMPPVAGIPGYGLAEFTLWLGMAILRVENCRRAPTRYRRFHVWIDAPFFTMWLGLIVWARLDPIFWRSSRAAMVVIPFGVVLLAWLGAQYVLLRKELDRSSTPRREGDV